MAEKLARNFWTLYSLTCTVSSSRIISPSRAWSGKLFSHVAGYSIMAATACGVEFATSSSVIVREKGVRTHSSGFIMRASS